MAFTKRSLHRMQRINGADTFNGRYRPAIRLARKHSAAFYGATIQVHGAGSTLTGIATNMCAREPQLFTKDINEKRVLRHVKLTRRAIDGECDVHAVPFPGSNEEPAVRGRQ
jgi:hypothetical protein